MDLILSRDRISQIEEVLQAELVDHGVDHAFIVDSSGNLITGAGNMSMGDILPLAALSAATFGATEKMAKLIGESDFTLLFHKGVRQNIHFSRMSNDFILVTLFGNNVSLGLIRLGINKAVTQILPILGT